MRWLARAALVTLAAALVTAFPAGADQDSGANAPAKPLLVVSARAVYSPTAKVVAFTVRFNHRPDFGSVDQYGRPRDSFQYVIVGDGTLPYPQNFDAVIRGDEITLDEDHGLLPIRGSGPPDPNPRSGGWGAIRASVPVLIRGSVLRFRAPLSVLSNHSPDGRLTYMLQTLNFGAEVSNIAGKSVIARRSEPRDDDARPD